MSKSGNKHNRLYGKFTVLDSKIQQAILEEEVDVKGASQFKHFPTWDAKDEQIVKLAPFDMGNNIFVNNEPSQPTDPSKLREALDACSIGFEIFASGGVLACDYVQGVVFHLTEAITHKPRYVSSLISQVCPTMKRLCFACQLSAHPRLLQPIYLIELLTKKSSLENLKTNLQEAGEQWRFSKEINQTDECVRLIGCMPLRYYFKLNSEFLDVTVTCMKFHSWEEINSDPLIEGSEANLIVKERRRAKELPEEIPPLDNFLDRL